MSCEGGHSEDQKLKKIVILIKKVLVVRIEMNFLGPFSKGESNLFFDQMIWPTNKEPDCYLKRSQIGSQSSNEFNTMNFSKF